MWQPLTEVAMGAVRNVSKHTHTASTDHNLSVPAKKYAKRLTNQQYIAPLPVQASINNNTIPQPLNTLYKSQQANVNFILLVRNALVGLLLGVLGGLLVGFYLGLDLSGLGLLDQQLLATALCLLGVDGLH